MDSRKNEENEDVIEIDHDAQFTVKIQGKKSARSIRSFEEPTFGLSPIIVKNVQDLGFKDPTPIQCHGMPQLMAQLDVMCCSCTGSGKTATYLLPIINMILKENLGQEGQKYVSPKALILTPTRELAEQICKDAIRYSKNLPISTLAVYGGGSFGFQLKELRKKKTDIVVATPGRLLQYLTEFADLLSLKFTKFLVIDEADEMFSQGFFSDINDIVEYMKPKEERLTAMFSATFPRQIQKYAKKHLRTDFVFVLVGTMGGAAPNIIQDIILASEIEKRVKLFELIEDEADKKILVFCKTKEKVDLLVSALRAKKLKPLCISSDFSQYERDQAIKDFSKGESGILIATSVAARGLNIQNVNLVINYDLPREIEEYIQRIGRARTSVDGELGHAISFYDEEKDSDLLVDLRFALTSGNQQIPAFLLSENENQVDPKQLDEFMDEDKIARLKKFNIKRAYETYDDPDFWG